MATIVDKKNQLTVAIICHEVTDRFEVLLKQVTDTEWISEAVFFDTSEQGVCADFITKTTAQSKNKLSQKISIHAEHIPIWNCDFAQIRNQILLLISTEWFMFLDSDELLSEAACVEIPQTISDIETNESYKSISAISIPRVDYFLGKELKYGEAGNASFVRIGKTNKVVYQRNVHEVPQVEGEILTIHTPIMHYAHTSVSEFISSVITYSYLEAQNRTWKKITLLEMLFYPGGKFLYTFFIKAGFLDGYRGLIYSFCMSLHSFFVRIYVWTK
jgi:glycosyltransferase involved in cell wall biosynthesis